MKSRLLLLAPLTLPLVNGCARSEAQMVKMQRDQDRGMIELSVYTDDFAMVRETRRIAFERGRARVGLPGVSKSLDQNSVVFRWPSRKDVQVVSSTYELGVSDSGRLLQRFLGKEIELVYHGLDGQPGERVKGTLEVADPGNIVVKADGKYIVNPNATIEAPADTGIVTIPQLSAEIESKSDGPADLAFSYMTGGLSWSADYMATLLPDSTNMGLECWATVTNHTGTDFPDAKISFVAGSPNRIQAQGMARAPMAATPAVAGALKMDEPQFAPPQAMGELYAYPYKSTATIRQDQMNRVRMMGSDGVTVKRIYTISLPGMGPDYGEFYAGLDQRLTASMSVRFTNSTKFGLGLPLPAGSVRVYEPDKTGDPHYIGAAFIANTPKDAQVSLGLSKVFDVYALARQVSVQRIDRRHKRRTVEVTLHNEKAKSVRVTLNQSLGDLWRIENETSKSRKLDVSTTQWQIDVPAGGEVKLRYAVVFGP
ncbi:DUF4139 domain-containing protein [soil metagenome]